MRKAEFFVPTEVAADFVEALSEHDFENTVTGVSDDGELIMVISYEKDEAEAIDELETYLDKLIEEADLGSEEENDEEEDED